MSETLQSPKTERLDPRKLTPEQLLDEALTLPGRIGNTYNRIHRYSLNNQILLMMQGVTGPVAPYKKWPELNRHVKRGAKGKVILVPHHRKRVDEAGEEKFVLSGFGTGYVFEYRDTEGEDLPPYEPPEWSRERALGSLGIQLVEFNNPSGNMMGYAKGNEVAISPIAPYPLKTLLHEMGHVALGHTKMLGVSNLTRGGLNEVQAESVAYIGMTQLAPEHFDPAESRAYIDGHRSGLELSPKDVREILTVTDRIVRAGYAQ